MPCISILYIIFLFARLAFICKLLAQMRSTWRGLPRGLPSDQSDCQVDISQFSFRGDHSRRSFRFFSPVSVHTMVLPVDEWTLPSTSQVECVHRIDMQSLILSPNIIIQIHAIRGTRKRHSATFRNKCPAKKLNVIHFYPREYHASIESKDR